MKYLKSSLNPKTKEENFNLAVADYLSKGLREKGMNCIRKNAAVEVTLDKPYLDKYHAVIIDCMDGNLYLRGKECKDKKWGKLRRFEGQRVADAYHCANQSITRIFNRIKSLNSDEKEVYAKEVEARREYYRMDCRMKTTDILLREDHRRVIGFIHNGKLIARAKDFRSKVILDMRQK